MEKLTAILIGILAASTAILAIQLVPLVTAHNGGNMSGGHMMDCMSGHMSAEEMDRNGDGLCDVCGMPISTCLKMTDHMEEEMTDMPMMSEMSSMGCHMGG